MNAKEARSASESDLILNRKKIDILGRIKASAEHGKHKISISKWFYVNKTDRKRLMKWLKGFGYKVSFNWLFGWINVRW
jgi:hypothetical protein